MNFKAIVFAAALLPASFGAFAADYVAPTQALVQGLPGEYSISFGATHATPGTFTDTFTFSYSGAASDAFGFFKNLSNRKSDIDFSSATLNGVTLDVLNVGSSSGAEFDLPVNGLLTLIISGESFSGSASYAGTLDVVSSVPEPTTYGMLLGGLGIMGFLARRRKQK